MLPNVSDLDSGGWGAWSPWSACTITCGGGTRIRYRACDSPPPRYGARFCEVRKRKKKSKLIRG